jgi:hypothetical protein
MGMILPDEDVPSVAANHDLEAVLRTDVSVIVNGHSHKRMVRTIGPLTVINAGTLKHDEGPCFLVADLAARHVQYYELGAGGIAPGPGFKFGLAGQDVWDRF